MDETIGAWTKLLQRRVFRPNRLCSSKCGMTELSWEVTRYRTPPSGLTHQILRSTVFAVDIAVIKPETSRRSTSGAVPLFRGSHTTFGATGRLPD